MDLILRNVRLPEALEAVVDIGVQDRPHRRDPAAAAGRRP